MTGNITAALERDPEGSRRVTLLELFFDLVYVVVLALISRDVANTLHWTGAFQAAVLLAAMWWVWAITTFVSDIYNPNRASIQLLTVTVMLGSLLMAATLPEAFGPLGLVFACTYVGIHLGRGLVLVPALHGRHAQRRAIRIFFWFAVSAVPWIAGGLVPDATARGALWALALALDYGAFGLRYPTPWLGRMPSTQSNVIAEHLAERYQQFFIIALGDTILVTGLTFSEHAFGAARAGAFLVAFAGTVLMWRIYTHRAGEVLPVAIGSATETGRLLRTAPYTHLVMVAGVVVTAASFQGVIERPLGRVSWAMTAVILGGPALFLVGRARFEYEVFGRVSRSRLVALAAFAAVIPAMIVLPPVGVAAGATLVLAGMALSDTARSWGRTPEEPAPAA